MDSLAYAKSKRLTIGLARRFSLLCDEKKEYVMARQLLKSGASNGADLAESEGAISRADFLPEIYIALKETKETIGWPELLHGTDHLTREQCASLQCDAEERCKMLSSTAKTMGEDGF